MAHDQLRRRLARLESELVTAAKAYLHAGSDANLDALLAATQDRNTTHDALAAVQAVDDRIYDAAGRDTGMRTGRSFMTPGTHHVAADGGRSERSEPGLGSAEPANLTRREQYIDDRSIGAVTTEGQRR